MEDEYNITYACFEQCRREWGVFASDYTLGVCMHECITDADYEAENYNDE